MAPGLPPPSSLRRGATRDRLARRSAPLSPLPPPRPLHQLPIELLEQGRALAETMWGGYRQLPVAQRAAAAVATAVAMVGTVFLLVFSHAILRALAPMAAGWRAHPLGWLGLWLGVFATAFPPLIGYSFLSTVCGFVFGLGRGWPIAASASVVGSLCSFLASRSCLGPYVLAIVGRDRRFVALGQVLRRDGLFVLTLVRLCPVPFSLSNGFLATIHSVSPWAFALATAITSPKLLVHTFIGSRLAILADRGDRMSLRDKAINWLGMGVLALLGMGVGLVVYRRTMARAAEIALQDGLSGTSAAAAGDGEDLDADDDDDVDAGTRLVASPDYTADLVDDDDISLWDNDRLGTSYRDEESFHHH